MDRLDVRGVFEKQQPYYLIIKISEYIKFQKAWINTQTDKCLNTKEFSFNTTKKLKKKQINLKKVRRYSLLLTGLEPASLKSYGT